jgi:hypothetical protein
VQNALYFSEAQEPVDHILGHKASCNKCNKVGIIPCILSDHNGIKVELNHKRNCSHKWGQNKILLNDLGIIEEIRGQKMS